MLWRGRPGAEQARAQARAYTPGVTRLSTSSFLGRLRTVPPAIRNRQWGALLASCEASAAGGLRQCDTAREGAAAAAQMADGAPLLPIRQYADDIRRAVETNDVVVVIGETGSGKTTQLSQVRGSGERGEAIWQPALRPSPPSRPPTHPCRFFWRQALAGMGSSA